jgi:hypothetical protein
MLKTRYFLLKKGKKGGVPFRPEPFFNNFVCKMKKKGYPHSFAYFMPTEGAFKKS